MLKTLYASLGKYLHYIYLLYAIPMVCLAATFTPPFQNPDEPNHFSRAEQISRLDFVPLFVRNNESVLTKEDSLARDPRIQYPDKGGFAVDKGIGDLNDIFSSIAQHPDVKVTAEKIDLSKNVMWGIGISYVNFANTAIYPPVVYIMPALGIVIGKTLDLSISKTLYLSRILNGAISIILCFFALLFAKRSNVFMFIVLLFPMTVAMFASVSQDAILISCAFLLVGIIDYVEFDKNKNYTNGQLYVMIILMSIIGVAKPPYLLFAFIFLFVKMNTKFKIASIVIPLAVLISWILVNQHNFTIKFAPIELRVNTQLQLLHIIHHPIKFIGLFFDFDKQGMVDFSKEFVGALGWLDLIFAWIYYRNAYIIFIVGLVLSFKLGKKKHFLLRASLFLCSLATLICVLTAQYITWTSLESTSLDGVQGRYALPIFPFLALAISGSDKEEKMKFIRTLLLILVLAFPIYSGVILYKGLMHRYY